MPSATRTHAEPAEAPAPAGAADGGARAGHVALVAVQICFGLFPLFAVWAYAAFEPKAIVSWRIAVGSAALMALAFLRHGRRALPRPRDLWRLQACALLGVVFNQVLFLEGLRRSTAANAGLLMPLIPVFTYSIAMAVRQERFSAGRALGIVVAFAGTAQLFLPRGPELDGSHAFGNLLIAINVLSYSCFLVLSRPLLKRYPTLVVIGWVYLLGLWTVPLYAHDAQLAPAGATRAAWLSLGYILVFPTVLAYLLNTFALSRVSASTTAVYTLLQPLIAVASGVLLLGERLAPATLLAGALIVAGFWLVVRREAPRVPIARLPAPDPGEPPPTSTGCAGAEGR